MAQFVMTDEELQSFKEACKPVPYLVFNGVGPESPYDKACRFWRQLGEKYGFDWETARPSGNDPHAFTAEAR